VQPLLKEIWSFLKNLKRELPHNPAIPLLDKFPKECASGHDRDTCTTTFIPTLFTLIKLWKQYQCPTTNE
jgi:hypothetical protein